MPSINSISSSSSAIIDQLIYIDSSGIRSSQRKISTINTKKDLFKDINSKVLDLQKSAETLFKELSQPSKTIEKSKEGVASLTVTANDYKGDLYLDVKQLAKNTIIGSDKFSGPIGIEGEFKLGDGKKSVTISVSKNDTVKSIKEKINENKEINISASIVDNRLTIAQGDTGNKIIHLSDPNKILEKIGITTSNGTSKNVLQSGQNALFSVNGIDIEREKNSIDDAIEGVTLSLQEIGTTTIKIKEDSDKTIKSMETFIEKYNNTLKKINTELNKEKGLLRGDSALMTLKSKMRTSLLTEGSGKFKNLFEIGIEMSSTNFGKNAILEIKDKDKLKKALTLDKDDVSKLFINDTNNNNKLDTSDGGVLGVLNNYLDLNTSTKHSMEGTLTTKLKGFDRDIEIQENRISRMETSLEKKRKVYEKQFLYMDKMTQLMNDQASGIAGMLNQMNLDSSSM